MEDNRAAGVILWHPNYPEYGVTADGRPVSAKFGRWGDPRPLRLDSQGRIVVAADGRYRKVRLVRFAAECCDRKSPPSLDDRAVEAAARLSGPGRLLSLTALARELGVSWETARAVVVRLRSSGRWSPRWPIRRVDRHDRPIGLAETRRRLARFRAASEAKWERTGNGRLTHEELIALFPDAPVETSNTNQHD